MVIDTFTDVRTVNIRYSLRKHLASLSLKIHIIFKKRFFRELDFFVPQTVRALSSTDGGFLSCFLLIVVRNFRIVIIFIFAVLLGRVQLYFLFLNGLGSF